MAKQNSIFKIKGPLGDYSFYTLNGEPVVRGKSGFRKGKIKRNPKYRKTMQNAGDFGKSSRTAARFRHLINPYLKAVADKKHYCRFNQLMVKVLLQDGIEHRGKRLFSRVPFSMLKGFHFNLDAAASTSRNLKVEHQLQTEGTSVIKGRYFVDENSIATHVKIAHLVVYFHFDDLNGFAVKEETCIPAEKVTSFSIPLVTPPLPEGMVAVQLIFLQHLQEVNGSLHAVEANKGDVVILDVRE